MKPNTADFASLHSIKIVRRPNTSRLDLTPHSAGLFAISLGLSATHADDHATLAHGLVIYDALYARCRFYQGEIHNWPPEGFRNSSTDELEAILSGRQSRHLEHGA